MNQLTNPNKLQPSTLLAEYLAQQGGLTDDLSAGVSGGFAVVGYRGKEWHIKHRKMEHPLERADGSAATTFDVVIVQGSPTLSKVWYEGGWTQGSTAPPDCYSGNSVRADPASPKMQNNGVCGTCPHNQWGSNSLGKGKACGDSRRLAVVPLEDLDNEPFGGPMLLRVPAASLGNLAAFDAGCKSKGYPYYAVAARVSFEPGLSYPKLVFRAMRALSDDEFARVKKLRDDPRTANVMQEKVELHPEEDDDVTAALPAKSPAVHPSSPAPDPFGTMDDEEPVAPPPAAAKLAPAPVTQKVAQATPEPAVPAHDPVTGEIEDAVVVETPKPAPKAAPKAAAAKPAPKPAAKAETPAANGAASGQDFDALLDSLL